MVSLWYKCLMPDWTLWTAKRKEETMELNSACRDRLVERLTAALQEVTFQNQYVLDYLSFRSLDSCSLTLPSRIQEQAAEWISSDSLRDFSYGFISENRSLYSKTLSGLSREDFPMA
jgi:hypothetical protein